MTARTDRLTLPIERYCATFLLLLSAFGCVSNDASVKTRIYEQPAIGWKEVTIPGNGITLSGILFQPVTQVSPHPAVIVLHGWLPFGYNGAENVSPLADAPAHSGIVALALSMRGWPNTGGQNDCGLRQSRDIDDVVRWLRSQENVDPKRLALLGLSQGGLVALLAASHDSELKAIVAYYAPVDVDDWQAAQPGALAQAFGQACQPGTPERSPINAAGSIRAPVLLVYGKNDQTVPPSQGREDEGCPREPRGRPGAYRDRRRRTRLPTAVEQSLARDANFSAHSFSPFHLNFNHESCSVWSWRDV
jgi:dienelactone hydrolase